MTENSENANAKPARPWSLPWLIASVCWMVFVAWRALNAWPRVPLDISGSDAATRAALQSAVFHHAINAALIAVAPPLFIYLMLRWLWPRA